MEAMARRRRACGCAEIVLGSGRIWRLLWRGRAVCYRL
jgi:hypothetical protein